MMRLGLFMTITAGTALTEYPGGGGPMQSLDHDGPAIFAHSQDFRDTPAAQMRRWVRRPPAASPKIP